MDTADRVSLVALLVSLIALVVAFLQLCQQYFATADGYRECAESVIGPWHRTRRRRFVPSEFRFETVYDAPLIRLLSISECVDRINYSDQHHDKRVHVLYPLNQNSCCEGESLLRETVLRSNQLPKTWLDGWRSQLPEWTGLRPIPKAGRTKHDGEKGLSTPWREFEAQSSALVSWIPFMTLLHRTYTLYGQVSNGHDSRERWLRDEIKQFNSRSQITSKPTQPVVEQQTINWDFRGSNITRPVAQTRLGDVILFALRMGMQWRTIDMESSMLVAVGNGYSLSSANRSGLILTFTSAGHHERPPSIIPSQYADKMLFGILPGDPDLVKKDFALVRRAGDRDKDERILAKILQPHGLDRGEHIRLGTKAARNDLKKLLCPFLPQKHANTATVRFLGWSWHCAESFIGYFESRVAFVQSLDAEVWQASSQYSEKDAISLRSMKTRLDELKDKYPSDFYCLKFTPRQTLSTTSSQQNSDYFNSFLHECEGIFEACTTYLKEHNWGHGVGNAPEGGSTKYALLVAAHTAITNNAIGRAEKDFQEAKSNLESTHRGDWAEAIGIEQQAPPRSRNPRHLGNPLFYFRMKQIVHDMRSEDCGIRQELGKLGVEVTDADAQLAWWMMMIRSIAWDMSCWREGWPIDERFVPSTFYGDPTPVMLA